MGGAAGGQKACAALGDWDICRAPDTERGRPGAARACDAPRGGCARRLHAQQLGARLPRPPLPKAVAFCMLWRNQLWDYGSGFWLLLVVS